MYFMSGRSWVVSRWSEPLARARHWHSPIMGQVNEPTEPARVLVVTDRTAATPALLDAIRDRVKRGPAQFRDLVPNPAPAEWHPLHPERRDKVTEAERVLIRALVDIQDAADDPVRGRIFLRHDAI